MRGLSRSTVLAAVGLSLSTPALAGDIVEAWDDGVTERAPRTLGARVGEAVVVGPTVYSFTDVEGSLPLHVSGSGRFGLGLNLGVASTFQAVPDESRSHLGVRSVAGDLWLWFGGEQTVHGFAWGLGLRPGDTASYLLQPAESANRTYLQYDGYMDFGDFDFSVLLRAGPNDRTLLELTSAVAALYEVNPEVAVSLGMHTSIAPGGYVVPGVRLRPADGVEVGVSAAIGLPLDEYAHPDLRTTVAPMVEIKAFDRGRSGG